ncbi:MAG TPA: chloride channel protein, partial [Xanthomonadaceae bacterium]|nr:chloride channel protein [Xanthomonadaceae bacterium]
MQTEPVLHPAADWLRRRFRASDGWFIGLAAMVGALAGAMTVLQGRLAHVLQAHFFGLPPQARLSASLSLTPAQLLVLPLGGLLLGVFTLVVRARRRALVDAVEANALHGGRMSMRDSLIVAGQTLLSNGFGASVGLEAAYAQMGAGAGSHLGRILRLRRADMRTLVGAGAGAAIAAAFGAPLTGAFYAFEIVIGAYSPSALAPVAAAALAGTFVAQSMGLTPYLLSAPPVAPLHSSDYAIYIALGMTCALVGIAIMRLVARVERTVNGTRLPAWLRPAIGGLLLVPLAALSPQVLSAGHGALHVDLAAGVALSFLATVFLLKCAASVLSLGFGFRGGLFFASLFLGTLLGALFARCVDLVVGFPLVDAANASLVGMAALAAGIIGSPMTMAMLVLEATHDFVLSSAVMAAVLVTSTLVRQVFGYSFSTWRLHLRGESIRSARDVGWMRLLTAGRMMRDTQVAPDSL